MTWKAKIKITGIFMSEESVNDMNGYEFVR